MAVTKRELHFTLHKIFNDSETGKKSALCLKEARGKEIIFHVVTPRGVEISYFR
jgi:hypothetical protein